MDELRDVRAVLRLTRRVDELVEHALHLRMGMAECLDGALQALCEETGARSAFVRTAGEDLTLALLRYPSDCVIPLQEQVLAATAPGRDDPFVATGEGAVVLGQRVDVDGEWYGSAGLVLGQDAPLAQRREVALALLGAFCEQIDNFLCAIRTAGDKQRVLMKISDALRHRVLSEGLRRAVTALREGVCVDRLLLVCVAEHQLMRTLHVQLYEDGRLTRDTMGAAAESEEQSMLRELGSRLLFDDDRTLLVRLGVEGALEEVLINGLVDTTIVGKLYATSRERPFSTHDRDLLAGFAGFVRQRIIDFNKEWRTLARSFRPADVARLLSSDGYTKHHLKPREEVVAMLYTDITGFTSLSEQVLRTPSAVADLVEAWSREAVQLVWEHGGVFDKMVGDCVIALFGPPFYDIAPAERLLQAIRCARAIRDMTRAMPQREPFGHLRATGLGVSTGVNLAPLCVGTFGPDDCFTGFSSGMNNTARLQGCAGRDEILVLSNALVQLPDNHGLALSEERSARVKNVAAPLRFRALL